MSENQKPKPRTFTAEFKQNAVDLIVKQACSFKAAWQSLGVDATTPRAWHRKLALPPEPVGDDALLAEVKAEVKAQNVRLRRELQRVEMEREILKKATAYFAKESM
jgi:transposase